MFLLLCSTPRGHYSGAWIKNVNSRVVNNSKKIKSVKSPSMAEETITLWYIKIFHSNEMEWNDIQQ